MPGSVHSFVALATFCSRRLPSGISESGRLADSLGTRHLEQKKTKETKQAEQANRCLGFAFGAFLRCLGYLLFKTTSVRYTSGLFKELTMHSKFQRADQLSREVIAAAIEVHRIMGPGLLESIYEKCFVRELQLRGITAVSEDRVRINYKGLEFEETLKFDVLVEQCLLVELKAVQELHPVHKAQLLSYMRLLDVPLGLLLNFHDERLVDGLVRLMLPGANRPPEQGDATVPTK
jgi:GxxExxY protein